MVLEEPTLTPELALDALEALAPLTTEVALPTLPILYQDDAMVVVSKPEKMLVHRTEIANGDTVFAMTCVREQLGRYVWPVHRLDRGTSGVLVFALSSEMASKLGRIMMAGDVKKRYVAMTRGGSTPLLMCNTLCRCLSTRISKSVVTMSRKVLALWFGRAAAQKFQCPRAPLKRLVWDSSKQN